MPFECPILAAFSTEMIIRNPEGYLTGGTFYESTQDYAQEEILDFLNTAIAILYGIVREEESYADRIIHREQIENYLKECGKIYLREADSITISTTIDHSSIIA